MNKFIIITSIFEPTEAVKKYANKEGWQLVVVGDKKSPGAWSYPNVTYLSAEDQIGLGYAMTDTLPWNHYCRKMIGYIYAVSKGADVIMDTDDDNIPFDEWDVYPFQGDFENINGSGFI